jgi:hypothetical protein
MCIPLNFRVRIISVWESYCTGALPCIATPLACVRTIAENRNVRRRRCFCGYEAENANGMALGVDRSNIDIPSERILAHIVQEP